MLESKARVPQLVELPQAVMDRGYLTVVDGGAELPFRPKRVYYLYDVPAGAIRGQHAHHELEQLMVCVIGAVTVRLQDPQGRKSEFQLNRPGKALFVPKLHWRELVDFAGGSVLVVLASEAYNENDYIRTKREFDQLRGAEGG